MTEVAYELVIVGGRLEPGREIEQAEELIALVDAAGGRSLGPWEYHFTSLDAAQAGVSCFRRLGVEFSGFQIKAVDADTGDALVS